MDTFERTQDREVFFSSDTHYFHKNILNYCPRPWKTVEEMNEAMIDNWNAVVRPSDTVYHLGDFVFGGSTRLEILKRLNGTIKLVKGNHDNYKNLLKSGRFEWIRDYHELKVIDPESKRGFEYFVLCHFPFLTWNLKDHGSWNLHGHVHNSIPVDYTVRRIDVGVDNPITGYAPISYGKLKEEMKKYSLPTVDHHGRAIGNSSSNSEKIP